MFTTVFQILNSLIVIGIFIGIPWFMVFIVRSIKNIERRLDILENKTDENKQIYWVYGEEPKGFIKEVEHSLEKNQNTIEHTLDKTQMSFAQKVKRWKRQSRWKECHSEKRQNY